MQWIVEPMVAFSEMVTVDLLSCCVDRTYCCTCKLYGECNGSSTLVVV